MSGGAHSTETGGSEFKASLIQYNQDYIETSRVPVQPGLQMPRKDGREGGEGRERRGGEGKRGERKGGRERKGEEEEKRGD